MRLPGEWWLNGCFGPKNHTRLKRTPPREPLHQPAAAGHRVSRIAPGRLSVGRIRSARERRLVWIRSCCLGRRMTRPDELRGAMRSSAPRTQHVPQIALSASTTSSRAARIAGNSPASSASPAAQAKPTTSRAGVIEVLEVGDRPAAEQQPGNAGAEGRPGPHDRPLAVGQDDAFAHLEAEGPRRLHPDHQLPPACAVEAPRDHPETGPKGEACGAHTPQLGGVHGVAPFRTTICVRPPASQRSSRSSPMPSARSWPSARCLAP